MEQECVREQYVARADEDAQRRDTGKIGMFRAQLGVIEGRSAAYHRPACCRPAMPSSGS